MRDLVQKGESRKAPLDVNQAIRGVGALIRAAALEDSVTVFVDLAPGLPLLIGDTIQVQQVVLNLVRNGMEAMRPLPKAERRMVVRSFGERGLRVRFTLPVGGRGAEARSRMSA